jgi:hypothetical protein
MKTLKIFLALLTFALLTISCNSDDDDKTEPVTYKAEAVIYDEENPLNAYMAISGFDQLEQNANNLGASEFGFRFKPTVTGKIKSLIVKIPVVNNALRVTLWDAATKESIKSEIINVQTPNVAVEQSIAPIVLIKDKEYLISINSDDWIIRRKEDKSAVIYPIVAGKITITGFAKGTSLGNVFPTSMINNYYNGDVTFKFQQTE